MPGNVHSRDVGTITSPHPGVVGDGRRTLSTSASMSAHAPSTTSRSTYALRCWQKLFMSSTRRCACRRNSHSTCVGSTCLRSFRSRLISDRRSACGRPRVTQQDSPQHTQHVRRVAATAALDTGISGLAQAEVVWPCASPAMPVTAGSRSEQTSHALTTRMTGAMPWLSLHCCNTGNTKTPQQRDAAAGTNRRFYTVSGNTHARAWRGRLPASCGQPRCGFDGENLSSSVLPLGSVLPRQRQRRPCLCAATGDVANGTTM